MAPRFLCTLRSVSTAAAPSTEERGVGEEPPGKGREGAAEPTRLSRSVLPAGFGCLPPPLFGAGRGCNNNIFVQRHNYTYLINLQAGSGACHKSLKQHVYLYFNYLSSFLKLSLV